MKEKFYNLFTNKLFIFVLLVLAILFSFFSNSYASYTFSVYDDDFILPDSFNYSYYVFTKNAISDEPFGAIGSDDPFYFVDNTFYSSKRFDSSKDVLHFLSSSQLDLSSAYVWTNSLLPSRWTINNNTVVYSNFDITDHNNNVVFHQAPAQGESQQGETQGIQTLTLEQVEQIPQAMTQTLQVVIPVGLVVFGIGLVIFLVRFLILRLM